MNAKTVIDKHVKRTARTVKKGTHYTSKRCDEERCSMSPAAGVAAPIEASTRYCIKGYEKGKPNLHILAKKC